jgi:hypothetical protein
MLLFNEGLFRLIGWTLVDLFRSRAALEAEIWTLRQQINVLRRTAPKRLSFSVLDHLVFVGLYRLFPKACDALAIVKPDTIIRWHRAGFRAYWRWKSRHRGGRPTVPQEIRKLIHEMSIANPLWSYAEFWVTRRSGGVVCRHVDDLDAVVESDTCNHLRQLICAFEPPPGF